MAYLTPDPANNQQVTSIPTPVAASTQIPQYRYVATNASGYAVGVSDTASLAFMGQASQQADNGSGLAGAISVGVTPISDAYLNTRYAIFTVSTSNATQAWVETPVYFTNTAGTPATVGQSSSHSLLAGIVKQYLSATQVLVDLLPGVLVS